MNALLTLVTVFSLQVMAPGADERRSMIQVRAGDARASQLLRIGTSRSETFRSLIDRIERSDVIVYVLTNPFLPMPGKTEFVEATLRWRYVRVTVRAPGPDTQLDVVSWLAHELQHAVEICDALVVCDDASLVGHYDDVGWNTRRGVYPVFETTAAQHIKWVVLEELYGG